MIAVDTNILIYAHRSGFAKHRAALNLLAKLFEGDDLWAIPVFCLSEFLRVMTHPAVLTPPDALESAVQAVRVLLRSESLRVLTPQDRFSYLLLEAVEQADARGNLLFDAQIVAVCREHGVETIWSNDQDMRRFQGIQVRSL